MPDPLEPPLARRSLLGLAVIVICVGALAGFIGYGALASRDTHTVTATPKTVPNVVPDDSPPPEPPAAKRAIPTTLPNITLTDRSGKPTALSSFAGRPLIVNFWATWCGPCRREIPLLNELRVARQAQGIEVVGIAVDFREEVLKYVEKTRVDYPLLIGEEDGLAAAEAFGIELAFPVSVFSDKKGRILAVKIGELHRNEAEFILDTVAEVDALKLDPEVAKRKIGARLQELALERTRAEPKPTA